MANPAREEQVERAGITDGRRRDLLYRAGLVLQMLGAAALAVLYPLGSPYYTAGIMLFELGVLLSALFLLVRMRWMKTIVLGTVLAGIPLQVFGMLYAPPEHAGPVILAGIGLVGCGAAGMAGKEAFCFAYREGWVLMGLLPAIMIVNLLQKEHIAVNALGFSALFLLLLSLAGKKLRQPLKSGATNDRVLPPGS